MFRMTSIPPRRFESCNPCPTPSVMFSSFHHKVAHVSVAVLARSSRFTRKHLCLYISIIKYIQPPLVRLVLDARHPSTSLTSILRVIRAKSTSGSQRTPTDRCCGLSFGVGSMVVNPWRVRRHQLCSTTVGKGGRQSASATSLQRSEIESWCMTFETSFSDQGCF